MAYIALYRAYRPQKFADVVGQEHIIKTLQNAITLNKVAHAYLFCGPRGTGKTTLAKIMAKAMNCVNGPSIEPCCECEICQGISKGTISDVIEIDAASNNGADDIRAIRDTVKYLPAVGKYKVYIIDEVHMLSNAAFNALLKTLEEPPAHVIFILATTEPYKLPNTILSRCQRFDFQAISIQDILKRLHIVASEENVKISEEALNQIATSAEGGMRDALSLFDQCISYSVNEEISLDDVLAVSGNISYLKIIDLLQSCIHDDQTNAIVLLDKTLKEGKEAPRIINDIVLFLRDVLLFKNNAILEEKLMFKNEKFIQLCSSISKSLIYSWLDILNETLNQMRFSIQKRAFLELAIIKMNDKNLQDNANLIERIESLEHTVEMLSRHTQEPKQTPIAENSNYQINIPTSSEIQQMVSSSMNEQDNYYEMNEGKTIASPAPVVIPPIVRNDSEDITIEDIEVILNNASKTKKEALLAALKQIADRYVNNFIVQLLSRGKIVAVSDSSFIAVFQDIGFCNRVMQYTNYIKIIEIFSDFGINLTDYVCISEAVWSKIAKDYKNKYSVANPKPKLEAIPIGIKRRVVPSSNEETKDTMKDSVLDLIDEDVLKIVEE